MAFSVPLGNAAAQSPGKLNIELNKLEDVDHACRAYLVFDNETGHSFSVLKLDLIMFGTDGVIAKRLAVGAAPLPAGKTRVKLFDIGDLACKGLDRLLLNGILACKDESGQRSDCLGAVELSSRADVSLVQ